MNPRLKCERTPSGVAIMVTFDGKLYLRYKAEITLKDASFLAFAIDNGLSMSLYFGDIVVRAGTLTVSHVDQELAFEVKFGPGDLGDFPRRLTEISNGEN